MKSQCLLCCEDTYDEALSFGAFCCPCGCNVWADLETRQYHMLLAAFPSVSGSLKAPIFPDPYPKL